jgi:Dolichyl-phosphate-mannose-protein mannosyltransferase
LDRKLFAALLAILALAGALRFWSLSWGLRQVPLRDESVFVENVARMVQEGDWDQRFYEYPGLFFYLLRPAFSALSDDALASARAYLVARGLVAAFGVASVALVFVIGWRLVSPRAGLVSALFAAVSPIEVVTAHMVRPDVVLETFALLALWSFADRSPSLRTDARSGLALGAAGAVKFTGILLVPAYLASLLVRQGARVRGMALAGLASLAVWLAATPYAWLVPRAYWRGVTDQWSYHYRTPAFAPRFVEILLYYLETLWNSFGPAGLVLVAVGIVAALRRWRNWAFLLAFPITMLLVLSTAEARWSRLLVPALGALALLAGLGFDAAVARWPGPVWALAVLGALWPCADSIAYVRDVSQPDTRDRALDWIEAHRPPGTRVLTNMPDLGLAAAGFEAVPTTGVAHDDGVVARNVDLVALDPGAVAGAIEGLSLLAAFDPTAARHEAPRIEILAAPKEERPRYREAAVATASSGVSPRAKDAPALVDHDLVTEWASEVDQAEQLELDLPEPACLGRVELLLGRHPQRFARALALSVTQDGVSWTHMHAADGRGPVREQIAHRDPAPSQVLVFEPVQLRGLRIEGSPRRGHRWGAAEVRLGAGESKMGCSKGVKQP